LFLSWWSLKGISQCVQPLDALGTFLESGLLGAQDHAYVSNISMGMLVTTALMLVVAFRNQVGLLGLWAYFKLPIFLRIASCGLRYFMPNGPYSTPSKKVQ
jgi:Na+-driven multidrug efflux pump